MTQRRALVAEDSLLILMALEMLLESHEVNIVACAATVDEAMALSQSVEFDIAVLDVNLQNEMVFPVADLLQERGTPIIFTTGYVPEAVLPARFLNTPAIQKPYENATLVALLEQAFTLARAKRQGRDPASGQQEDGLSCRTTR